MLHIIYTDIGLHGSCSQNSLSLTNLLILAYHRTSPRSTINLSLTHLIYASLSSDHDLSVLLLKMPAMNRTLKFTAQPLIHLRSISSTSSLFSNYGTGGFINQTGSYSSTYEPGEPTKGPLGGASPHGALKLTPTLLKEHLDKYVVGQDKAKKVTSVAIYNHYQRIRELRRREEEERERREQRERWEMGERERNAHPVESKFLLGFICSARHRLVY